MTYASRKNLLAIISPTPYDKPLLLDLVTPPPHKFFLGVALSGVFLVGSGGAGAPYSYSIISGSLPTGLSLNGSTGEITGTPTVQGAVSFVAEVQDSASNVFPHSFTINIESGLEPVVYRPTIGENGVPYRFAFIVRDLTGTTVPSGYTVSVGTLPDGLSLSGAGVVSGTPTALAVGVTQVTINVTYLGASLDISCTFTIADVVAVDFVQDRDPPNGWGGGAGSWLPTIIRGVDYEVDIVVTGGVPPYSFLMSPVDPLPSGILLRPQDLMIRGKTMDAASGNPFSLALVVTDALGATANAIRAYFLLDSQQGRVQPRKNGVDVSGGDGPLNWNFIEGSNVTITTSSDGVNFDIQIDAAGGGGTPANPTASVGLTAVNGVATTYMRSDAAPKLDVGIAPTWTGVHEWTQTLIADQGVDATGGDFFAESGNVKVGSLGHVRTLGIWSSYSATAQFAGGMTGDADPPTYLRVFVSDQAGGKIDAVQCEVGTGNTSIEKSLSISGVISPSALASGNTDDWNPSGLSTAAIIRVTPNSGGSTLRGIVAPNSFGVGKLLYLLNLGSGTLTLISQSIGSTAANRFILGSISVSIASGQTAVLWYDSTSSRWRLAGIVNTQVSIPNGGPGCAFSNGGLPLSGTLISEIEVPYNFAGTGWTIVGDTTGSGTITVTKASYSAYPTQSAVLTATVSSASKNQAIGLSYSFSAGDIVRFSGSGFSGFNRCSIKLDGTPS